MKKCFLITLVMLAGMLQVAGAKNEDPNLGIIPAPVSIARKAGTFHLTTATRLAATGTEAQQVAGMFNAFLKENYGYTLKTTQESAPGNNSIVLAIRENVAPKEGYRLAITRKSIAIQGADGPGLFHGLQSLIQMLPVEKQADYTLPCAIINDYPRFTYRGMHLDCGRHFFPVSFVKEYLDMMARYKFNTFHWHLTEDQGWRIEIKKYPRLTTIGSRRNETVIGHNSGKYDGKPYGGYYTQDQIRDVVQYARERYITIIPEIEMPGHSLAALTAYPLLGCTNGPYQVGTKWGVFKNVYCAGKESTFQFLENVLTEVMALFPSHYIHIGGDESPKDQWKTCPYCQKRIKDEGLKDEHGLQSYFISRMEKFLNAHGRDIIGWDEILEGGLAPNATVMSWRGEKGGIAAAKQHHDVIMTPGSWCYFDHAQSRSKKEPLNIGGYLPLSKVYGYNPVPPELNTTESKYIIGVQANLWTEYIPSVKQAEYMIMPRMMAMAEVAWTPLKEKNYDNFLLRVPRQLQYLDDKGIHFRIPEPAGLQSDTVSSRKVVVKLQPAVPGAKIYYTLDGSDPTASSTRYSDPIRIDLTDQSSARLNVIEVTPSGNTSIVYSATYLRKE
jgi:hexosaminidase